MYVKDGLNQRQIAKEVYGDESRQGNVSKTLKKISKVLNVPLTKLHGKKYRKEEYTINLDDFYEYSKRYKN